MGGSVAKQKKNNLKQIILTLLESHSEISIHDVASAANLSTENASQRRSIQRVFQALLGDDLIVPLGNARARTYALKSASDKESLASAEILSQVAFREIALGEKSKKLLKYVSQSLKGRIPVGYNQEFLRLYEPNKTFYLGLNERKELSQIGTVEHKVRPAGTYARNIMGRLLIDLSWNSSRLEGNTYSLLETKRLIELGESAAGKDLNEAQMILNHKSAIEYIVESASEELISSHEICSIHALLSENLLGDPSASGKIREIIVGISGTTYLPLENPQVLKECFGIFIEKLNLIEDPFEQSLFSLVHLSYIQAFEDVNKRTARLVANIPLIKKNLRPLSFTDVDQEAMIKSLIGVYEKNDVSLLKDLYIWAYRRSSQRYSAIQQAMGEPNHLRLKHRVLIQEIIRIIILEKVTGGLVVSKIHEQLHLAHLEISEEAELFKIIETEIYSLHEGNIARFKLRPSEYNEWVKLQS